MAFPKKKKKEERKKPRSNNLQNSVATAPYERIPVLHKLDHSNSRPCDLSLLLPGA
jgi:hypothetical protein